MRRKLKCPITKQTVVLHILENSSDIEKEYNLLSTENYSAFVFSKSEEIHIVFIRERITLGILVHEVVHLINFLYVTMGQELDRNNDEFQAYYTQYWFERINKIIDKNK